MNNLFNLEILRNPRNWVSIGAMILISIMAIFVLWSRFQTRDKVETNPDTAANVASEA